MKVKVVKWCLTLCDPMDYTVHGILQARILEWVAFPFSRDLPNPEIESRYPALRADSLPAEPQNRRWNNVFKCQERRIVDSKLYCYWHIQCHPVFFMFMAKGQTRGKEATYWMPVDLQILTLWVLSFRICFHMVKIFRARTTRGPKSPLHQKPNLKISE